MQAMSKDDEAIAVMQKLFTGYKAMVRQNQVPKQKELLLQTVSSLQNVLKEHRQDCSAPSSTGDAASAQVAIRDRKRQNRLAQLERTIAARIELKTGGTTVQAIAPFRKFDHGSTGRIKPAHFQAAIASMGISLNPTELELLCSKYSDNQNAEDPVSYMQFLRQSRDLLHSTEPTLHSTTSQVMHSGANNRIHVSAREMRELSLEHARDAPSHLKLQKGLAQMRERMYLKSSRLTTVFRQLIPRQSGVALQNNLPLAGIVPSLHALGFPEGLVSDAELAAFVATFAKVNPGVSLTYPEFASLAMGRAADANGSMGEVEIAASHPALVGVLVKLNCMDLRREFMDADLDQDGFVSRAELVKQLEKCGLSTGFGRNASFLKMLDRYTNTEGNFTLPGFIRFVTQPRNGEDHAAAPRPDSASQSIVVPDDMEALDILKTVWTHCRGTSVKKVFQRYDLNGDGSLAPSELYFALTGMGVELSKESSQRLFDSFDADHNGRVSLEEMSNVIINPNKHRRMHQRIRFEPGGHSSINLDMRHLPGDDIEPPVKRGGDHAWNNWNASSVEIAHTMEVDPATLLPMPRESKTWKTTAVQPKLNDDFADVKAASARKHYSKMNRSTVDFGNDHGSTAAATPSKRGGRGFHPENQVDLTFNPHEPLPERNPSNIRDPGFSHLKFTASGADGTALNVFREEYSEAEKRPAVKRLQPESMVNFAPVSTPHRPVRGKTGNTTLSSVRLELDPTLPIEEFPSRPNLAKANNSSGVALGINMEAADDEAQKLRAQQQARPSKRFNQNARAEKSNVKLRVPNRTASMGASALQLEMAQAEIKAAHNCLNPTWGGPSMGNEVSVKAPEVHVPFKLLKRVGDAVYSRARVTQTFRAWAKSKTCRTTLSKERFKAGAESYGVSLSDEETGLIFKAYDSDLDGAMSYADFVRMLNASNISMV